MLFRSFLQEALEPRDGFRVEVVRGLVEQQQVRLRKQQLRQQDAQAEPTRQLAHRPRVALVRDAEALAAYDELLTAFPKGRLANTAQFEKALTYYHMGNYAEAVKNAKDLPLTLENRKDLYWLLAESHAALKEDDDAVQYYRLIATEFPKSDVAADATYRLAYHLQTRGDNASAGAGVISPSAYIPIGLF